MTQVQADIGGANRGTDQGTRLKPGGSSTLNMPLAGDRGGSGNFWDLSSLTFLWSSSGSVGAAWFRQLDINRADVGRYSSSTAQGLSVRCLGN